MEPFPDFDIAGAAKRINEANRREDAAISERRLRAQDEARRIAGAFRAADLDIRRIWGFGSAFESGRPFRLDSDIDLAIEGGDIISLLPLTERSDFKVDLIDISGIEDEFARGIRERGALL